MSFQLHHSHQEIHMQRLLSTSSEKVKLLESGDDDTLVGVVGFCCHDESHDHKRLEKGRVCSTFQLTALPEGKRQQEPREEGTQRQELKRKPQRGAAHWFAHHSFLPSLSYTICPEPPAQGWHNPSLGPLFYKLAIKKTRPQIRLRGIREGNL